MKNKRSLALVLAVLMLAAVFVTACKKDAEPDVSPPPSSEPAPQPEPAPAPAPAPAVPDAPSPDPAPSAGREPFVRPDIITNIPRNEALYFMGFNWGAPNGWNAFAGGDMNNSLPITQDAGGARLPTFEAPYMYNPLDNKMYPLIADGDYSWNADLTELTYKIKAAAYWSDGTKVTAHDAAFTFSAGIEYGVAAGIGFASFIDSVEAKDDETVVIHCALVNGKPANPLMVVTYIGQNYILQKAWLETLIARNNGDSAAIVRDPGNDVVWSGPYAPYYFDDQKVVLIRDDGYWGQDASMWGKLPTPKYIVHPLFEDNDAGAVAFADGLIDVSQDFIPNIQDMWLVQGLPISTYLENPPYGMCVNMPTAYFNMNSPKPGLDNPAVRKAIAMAVDYDLIIANAMTNQSPTFAEYPRSLMAPLAGEQAMYDQSAVADLQWIGNDIDGANALLDAAGIAKGGDGYRRIDGVKLSYNACCPQGWSDWEAAMEIVAAAGEKIGIEITTNFPDWGVYQTVVTAATHSEYDIFMMWTDSTCPASPWLRARYLLSSEFIGIDSNWSGNWGHYSNPRADELLTLIPLESNEAKVKEYYTELVKIYLTDVPSFSLMYRPDKFHAVNESVWTGFTEATDGRNVPPINCVSGYAIADLYNLRLV